ncbi:hypothetical protein KAR91_59290 [Candidatus Pacearchaeota archaeon]|nr:hypothetical protein [Candidatus Pacearchaeota archaeon]
MNNYVLIARNTTFIYEVLRNDFDSNFPDDKTLLATSGVIDTLEYIEKKQLAVDDVQTGVMYAEIGKCFLDLGCEFSLYYNPFDEVSREDHTLLCFILQLEAYIFRIDTNTLPRLILNAIKTKSDSIKRTIESTQMKYKNGKTPSYIKSQVHSFMNDDFYAGLRKNLGVTD